MNSMSDDYKTIKIGNSHLRWMWPYIRKHWKRGAMGGLGLAILSALALPSPYIIKIIIDQAIGSANLRLLNILIVALFGIQATRFGISWGTNYLFNRYTLEVMTDIKKDLFNRILRFPMHFFDAHQTGYLMSRIGEVEGLNLFFSSTLASIIISIGQFIFCLAILFHLNTTLTLFSLLFLPLMFAVSRLFTRDLRRLSWQYYEKSADLSRGLQESLSGIEIVKSFGAEDREAFKFQAHLNELKHVSIHKTLFLSLYSETFAFISAGVGFIILWLSGGRIISGHFTLGSYLAFAAYFGQLIGPTQMFANLGVLLQPAKVALLRIQELLTVVSEEMNKGSRAMPSLQGRIELLGISFGYLPGRRILNDVNLQIFPGEKILIAGPNGSGKSTLIKLIMGFYKPNNGEILIDGIPIEIVSVASLRDRISLVSQNTFLFSDTIRNNILYSAPQAAACDFEDAIKVTGVLDFAKKLPWGLETETGERGVRLSGGEKQKISIARAILRKSDVLIFDEATTHLDESSIRFIGDIIESRFIEKTCLIISHRPIEQLKINRLLRIENGRFQEVPLAEKAEDFCSVMQAVSSFGR
jgi:ATP-binding cassette subfamily B protein